MPLNESVRKTYLRVSYGKICKTCDETTPKAIKRVTKDEKVVWELQWESITAKLDSIAFRDDEKFGKSWNVGLIDGDDLYVLQINEDSRFGIDFLKQVPNLRHGRTYTFRPYDYEKNNKRKAGIWITEIAFEGTEKRVESFYQEFTQKSDGKWDVKNLNGFPEFDGDVKDKDDLKIYFVKLAKFLRSEALKHIQAGFQSNDPVVSHEPEPPAKPEDDLPF
jgi:hypothetical protein